MNAIRDRIAIQREVTAKVRRKTEQGKDAKTIRAEVREEMEKKYGTQANWSEILSVVLAILSILLKVL